MNQSLIMATALLALASTVHAAHADTPALYARTMPLTVSGKEAVAQLLVPKEVYMASRSVDLYDLRIFDRNGKAVPFAILPQAQVGEDETKRAPATIFALNDRAAAADAALSVRATIDGKLVSLDASSGGAITAAAKLGGLILDLGAAGKNAHAVGATALQLQLPAGLDTYTARIAVEVSDDLKQWTDDGEAVVSWLANADRMTLASDRIELDGVQGRYARLRWREGTPLQFGGVVAEWRGRTLTPRHIETLLVTGRQGRAAGDIVYPAAQALPVRSLGLQFEQRNVVTQAVLGRYVEVPVLQKGQPPRFDFDGLYRATFYRLEQGGKVRASTDFAAEDHRVDQWVLRPASPLTPAPVLRLNWEPARLVFFAAGAVPYTLAVGRDHADSGARAVSAVAPGFVEADLAKLEQAAVGAIHDQAIAPPSDSDVRLLASAARTRTVILWTVLIIGVLAVLLMTRQLMRQMRQAAPADDAGGGAA